MTFEVPFTPLWKRPRRCGNKYFHREEDMIQREHLRQLALQARPNNWDLEGYYIVQILATIKKPKKLTMPYPSRPDVDNIAKEVLDALQNSHGVAIMWKNDSHVIEVNVKKTYGDENKTKISVKNIKKG